VQERAPPVVEPVCPIPNAIRILHLIPPKRPRLGRRDVRVQADQQLTHAGPKIVRARLDLGQ
jgi:hypothetical protein